MLLSLLLAMSPPPQTTTPQSPEAPVTDDPCKRLTIDGGNEAGTLARGHTQVDATKLSAGEAATVGPAVGDVRGLELVEALLTTNTIRTWVHIGSELCLTLVDGAVRVEGTHTYFTNEENVVPIAFDVTVDEAGVIHVTGR